MSSEVEDLDALQGQVHTLLTLRYLIVSGAAIYFYDIILTFPSEITFLWDLCQRTRRSSLLRLAYIFSRYGFCVLLTMLILDEVGPMKLSNGWPPDCATIGLVLYRIFLLWDRNAAVRAGIIGGIVVAYAICIPFVFLFAKGLREHTTFQSLGVYSICFSMVATRKLEGIWWPQALLDVYAILLIVWNAMTRPRLQQQKLLQILEHDGLGWIILTWIFRILSIIFCFTSNAMLGEAGLAFNLSVITTLMARLFLKLHIEQDEVEVDGKNTRGTQYGIATEDIASDSLSLDLTSNNDAYDRESGRWSQIQPEEDPSRVRWFNAQTYVAEEIQMTSQMR